MKNTTQQKLEHAEAQLRILHEDYHHLAMSPNPPKDAMAYFEKQIAQKESEIDDLTAAAFGMNV